MVDPVDVSAIVPAAEDPQPAPDAPDGVTSGTEPEVVGDRPLKNLQAEFNRKLSRVEQQYADLTAMLQQALQPKPPAPPANTLDQYTNEQLAQLAQAGSADAQQKLTERMVSAQVQAATAQQNRTMAIQAQHASLYARYKQLNDPSSPLTQYAMQAKAALLRQGYPNSVETDVEAIKTAIVDNAGNPQVMGGAQMVDEPVRRAGVQAQSQIDGNTSRRHPAPAPPGKAKLSEKELALANRMGIKDPEGSKARFEKRQADGRSALGAVGLHVRES